MRNSIKIFVTGLIIVSSTLFSCKKISDWNQDPNDATDAPTSAILNSALIGIVPAIEGENARLACMWSGQFTGSDRQYSAFQVYNVTADDFDWGSFYYAVAEQAKIAIAKAEEENNRFYTGVGKISQALAYGTSASLWGDVPMAEANDLVTFPDPQFDGQLAVYSAVQALLDEAILDLENSESFDLDEVDFYYAGDASSWIAVAHSLKARYYLHVGNYSSALSSAANGISSSVGDWMIPHGGQYNQNMNFYNSFGVEDRAGYMTAAGAFLPTMIYADSSTASSRDDSLTSEMARFRMIYTGSAGAFDLNYDGMWSATSSFPIISAVETHLIMAEAELAANNDEDAALAHLNAVRAENATNYGGTYGAYDISAFDVGGIQDQGLGSIEANLMHEIMEEKYVSLVGQIEVYNDLRRTNNILGVPSASAGGANIPERFLYPQEEIDANSNTPSPIPGLDVPTAVNQ